MTSNAMNTALALPSSKTNWTATLPARAPPPPPPVKEILGQCQCCECDVTTEQDYLKLKNGPGAGRIYCEEHVGWGECQKAWSGSCGCDVCADQEEDEGARCDICCGCGKFTETGNVCDCGGAHRELCDDCKEDEATTEFARNKICDECGCKGGCELTCVYVCGEPCEDIVGCCEKCDMEIVRDSEDHDNCLIIDGGDSVDKFCCQSCGDMKTCEHCEGAVSDEGGKITVLGVDITICENCDTDGDGYDGWLDEYHYNAETNDYEEKKEEDSDEVKQYKAVLAETLRYEAIMDMMKKK